MKSIMVVDDSLMMRISLKKLFEKNGFEVVAEAVNGLDAIEKYSKFQPDLTTLDITMPVMDGIATLQEIVKIDRGACVVMISALGQERKIIESIKAGAKHYIQKPINESHAIDVIRSVLNLDEEEMPDACCVR